MMRTSRAVAVVLGMMFALVSVANGAEYFVNPSPPGLRRTATRNQISYQLTETVRTDRESESFRRCVPAVIWFSEPVRWEC